MALGIVKYADDRSSQLFGVVWFAVSCRGPDIIAELWWPWTRLKSCLFLVQAGKLAKLMFYCHN